VEFDVGFDEPMVEMSAVIYDLVTPKTQYYFFAQLNPYFAKAEDYAIKLWGNIDTGVTSVENLNIVIEELRGSVANVEETDVLQYGNTGNNSFEGFETGYTGVEGRDGVDAINYDLESENASFTLSSLSSSSTYCSKSGGPSAAPTVGTLTAANDSIGAAGDPLVGPLSSSSDFTITAPTTVTSPYSGKYGEHKSIITGTFSETLSNIERLYFTDKAYALDIDCNAGNAAKVIIATFGADSLGSYLSAALSVVDGGTTLEGLCDLVVYLRLIENVIGSSTNGSFVDHVYENVVGVTPSQTDHDTYTALLDNGTYTKSSLLALAANTTLTEALVTANSVDLIGVPGSADGEILALQYDIGLG
jgi:hypothetical protein